MADAVLPIRSEAFWEITLVKSRSHTNSAALPKRRIHKDCDFPWSRSRLRLEVPILWVSNDDSPPQKKNLTTRLDTHNLVSPTSASCGSQPFVNSTHHPLNN